jgi:hypothetical protein
MFWPRTFYRSGWLRCDVFNCVVFVYVLSWCSVLSWCLCVVLYIIIHIILSYTIIILILLYLIHTYIILYYTILYYTYYIIYYILYYTYTIIYYTILLLYYYYILYYTLLFFCSLPNTLPLLIYSIFYSHPLLFPSPPSILPNIHSILVGTYIYLFILFCSLPKYLTPHKLSEGCLEWCSFICVVFGSVLCFDPARSIGVDGWGV